MNLLAMLVALGAERLLSPYRDAAAQRRLWAALRQRLALPAFWHSAIMPPLLVLGAAALALLLERQLPAEPLRLLYAGIVLFLCLGPRDLADDVQRLRAARAAGNSGEVARLTRLLQMGPEPDADHRSLLGALFIQSHERLFGTLWWFIACGPAGAVAYRLASRLPFGLDDAATPATRSAALQHALFAWLPARLTALLFALAGSMDDSMWAWRRLRHEDGAADWRQHTWAVLSEVANAALDWEDGGGPVLASSLDAALSEVLRMQTRALLILLAFAALLAMGAWIA
ncbi:MAG: regulatory signaling modulator protein AmpE [Nevskia sp.]|nr:regulatory signaling modulator protein AmpE [Nevskia sp.]